MPSRARSKPLMVAHRTTSASCRIGTCLSRRLNTSTLPRAPFGGMRRSPYVFGWLDGWLSTVPAIRRASRPDRSNAATGLDARPRRWRRGSDAPRAAGRCPGHDVYASQRLLLMIPNMFKIPGELTPFTMHVAARTVATMRRPFSATTPTSWRVEPPVLRCSVPRACKRRTTSRQHEPLQGARPRCVRAGE
jgi:Pyruvate flavodoxin/ferredoxin oxidoreductase, thiamine diP-bdg